MKFRFLGPRNRPRQHGFPPWEFCACGMAFTSEWVHFQTKHHKDAVKRWRKEERERRAA